MQNRFLLNWIVVGPDESLVIKKIVNIDEMRHAAVSNYSIGCAVILMSDFLGMWLTLVVTTGRYGGIYWNVEGESD